MSNIMLPEPPLPAGRYAAVVVRQGIGFVSGQFPIQNGRIAFQGRVGLELTLDEGSEACRVAALNVLAQISSVTDGFSNLDGILRLDGYIASADHFQSQPIVLDAASELFEEVLSNAGRHARGAFAVPRLPLNAAVELCVSFALKTKSNG
ncbi:MAG: RidA family protein [Pseudomonadota bacterium]